ncbi:MAG: cobalt-precorrin-5B (C(1))-methyltransferase [Deltaproteobacteria bacterium]|nr:cobalt-precorrin-5B (C(1))-methyltransferase [Candidatus Anaeroferrophillacea bacterium]
MTDRGEKRLRTGFSTGACAAAGAVAAWLALYGRPPKDAVTLRFPDGTERPVPLDGVETDGETATARIIKDGGDDIDITDGAMIRVHLAPVAPEDTEIAAKTDDADFIEPCGKARLIIRGGDGVGRVTRAGLDVPPGKWAVNPEPRRMIIDNLACVGFGREPGCRRLIISVDRGERLAQKTLNPVLGIEGGISILGTSGLVIPCSNAAYLATITVLLRGAAAMDLDRVALVTGGRTHRWTKAQHGDLPEAAIIRIGDFIHEAVAGCREHGFRRVTVGCMAGKLAKYALGIRYTHAHRTALSLADLAALLDESGLPPAVTAPAAHCRSVREYLGTLDAADRGAVIRELHREAMKTFAAWAPEIDFELLVFSPGGEQLA